MLNRIELEWKILFVAVIILFFVTVPMRTLFDEQLDTVVSKSIDTNLQPYLEQKLQELSSLESPDSSEIAEKEQVISLLARHLQWRSTQHLAIERQKRGFTNFSTVLIILAVIGTFFIFYRMTLPIKKMASQVKVIGSGGSAEIVVTSSGALRVLEQNLLEMQNELVGLRRKAEVQGMESAWRDIARIMAHEIKNPLTPMRLLVDRLDEQSHSGSPIAQDKIAPTVERMNRQLDTLEELVNRYRSFSSDQQVNLQSVPIAELTRQCCDDFSGKLTTEFHGDSEVRADKTLFQQIVLNLCKNAANAGADKIDVSIVEMPETTTLHFKDNGCGIEKDKFDRLFIPYVSYSEGGSGIGLSVVKRLVECMNGSVSADSEPGKSFTLSITLQRDKKETV